MKQIYSIFLLFLCTIYLSQETERQEIVIGPTDFLPLKDDVYICGSLPMNGHGRYYIQSFVSKLKPGRIHHFMVTGCRKPGSTAKFWNSANSFGARQPGLGHAFPCEGTNPGQENVMFAWEHNTNDVFLPEDVSYEVGWDTEWKYLVYEIHYPNASYFSDENRDNSKIIMTYRTNKTKHAAGYLASAPSFQNYTKILIQKHKATDVDIIYGLPQTEIHPLFYQVHTHGLGTKVSGYWVKYNSSDPDSAQWIRLGARDPTLPQLFLPTETDGPMRNGDLFVVRCHYYNFRDVDVRIGNRHQDEMCNFYIIYWTDWGKQLGHSFLSENYTMPFQDFGLKNIPDEAL